MAATDASEKPQAQVAVSKVLKMGSKDSKLRRRRAAAAAEARLTGGQS